MAWAVAAARRLADGPVRRRPRGGVAGWFFDRSAPGQAVVTRNLNPPGHTRLPRYARGKAGIIARASFTLAGSILAVTKPTSRPPSASTSPQGATIRE